MSNDQTARASTAAVVETSDSRRTVTNTGPLGPSSVAGDVTSQRDRAQQAAEDAATANRELQATYKRLWNNLTPESRKLLKDAQSAWDRYATAQSALEANTFQGGSVSSMAYYATKAKLIRARIQELQSQFDNP